MIIVNGIIDTDAETIEAVKDAMQAMEVETRKEPGCHDYSFSVEISNPTRLRVTEKWENMDALKAHFSAPHMATFQATLAKSPPKHVDLRVFDVTELELPGR